MTIHIANKCGAVIVAVMLITSVVTSQSFAAPRTAKEKQVDDTIVKALQYLADNQDPSGAWKTDSYGESTATTSLSVMAFLAAGHVPNEGPYGRQIVKGIRWVLDHQEANGMLVHRRSHGPMYSHGISTLMLAEVAGMVDGQLEKDCQAGLEDAIRLILKAQQVNKNSRHAGGWRYQANSPDSDLSVTGWQLLALRAAKDVGCDVPADAIEKAVDYVKGCAVRGNNGFGYQSGSGPTPTRTGTGILCLEVCGQHHAAEALGGADFLLRRPLKYNDNYFFYGVYYCTVGMFKVGDKYWDETKKHLVQVLVSNQEADGSWLVRGRSESRIGRVYCTSMSVLALAVEYQYLPIYQR
ncbi:MAG: terpene cyclase/mutase family protein [Planctomycetaceae bacterium]|jgi:hypothetical protein|nr:terpene cyclase/mutase family protein [Planctomycetaceae bacterium]MBT6484134.1 terpene cyclase/mutase family protein [Planctomycetaceae bacterium]MBT6493031.1 terpene cyclase/mutase family protein [Planctomycetaceae bacterium]